MKSDGSEAIFRDRLTLRLSNPSTASKVLLGRWVLESDSAILNSELVRAGDFLVPQKSGRFAVMASSGGYVEGVISRPHLPDVLARESVTGIGRQIEAVMSAGGAWAEWLNIVPLLPRIEDHLGLNSLELQIENTLGNIEFVCRNPVTHLQVDLERVPVSRAKRVPAIAAAFLAAHTEDWGQRKLTTIEPRRILAETRHELYDIYENRMVARLVDQLIAYLGMRVRYLKRLLKMFEEKEDFGSEISGTYQRANRIAELWGELINASEGRDKTLAALRSLEGIRYRLLGLLGSVLYKETSKQAIVASTLKTTNLLSNHQHYRRIADLWRAWALSSVHESLNQSEHQEAMQVICRSFDKFVMLLIVRALNSLGLAPGVDSEATKLAIGSTIDLEGRGLLVRLTWRNDGSVELSLDNRTLRIVGIVSDIGAGSGADVRKTAESLRADPGATNAQTLIVYLASEDTWKPHGITLSRSVFNAGNDPRLAVDTGSCLPVAPWKITSAERVGRALRWFLLSGVFESYPHRVGIAVAGSKLREAVDASRSLELEMGNATVSLMRRPPSQEEWERIKAAIDLPGWDRKLKEAQLEVEAVVRQLGKAKGSAKASYAHAERVTRTQLKEVGELKTSMADTLSEMERAWSATKVLAVCPTCGETADARSKFEPLSDGCFRCSCDDCGTEWGLRLCADGHRYPFMLPSGAWPSRFEERPQWVDGSYGCDILALPAQTDEGDWGFLCPACGLIS